MAKVARDELGERLAKLRTKIPHDWEDLDGLSADDLKAKIVEAAANVVSNKQEKETDRQYNTAKATLSKLAAPYKEADTRLRALMEYASLRLEELGK